jgi:hypothetical protein
MENKYFTPDIEDICIGYELEHLSAAGYITTKFEIDSSLPALQELIKLNQVRVPYLTKEQIEAEGWERTGGILYRKNNYDLGYREDNKRLKIATIGKDSYNLFIGECKDINTFRKIIKLLGI